MTDDEFNTLIIKCLAEMEFKKRKENEWILDKLKITVNRTGKFFRFHNGINANIYFLHFDNNTVAYNYRDDGTRRNPSEQYILELFLRVMDDVINKRYIERK